MQLKQIESHPPLTDAKRAEIGKVCAMLVLAAGGDIMNIRCAGPHVRYKADRSPVCEADERAEAGILAGLALHFPDIPVVAEEDYAAHQRTSSSEQFFLVDALDGTKEYVTGQNGFSVNIALIDHGTPCAGAVFAPALGRLWFAGPESFCLNINIGSALPDESLWQKIQTRSADPDALTALSSRSHADARSLALLSELAIKMHLPSSSSLKFCLIAEGLGDIYPRFSPIMEWDTAAGDAILRSAGGIVMDSSGADLTYGRATSGYRSPGFVALGDPALRPDIAAIMSQLA